MSELGPFPVDDVALDLLLDSLNASYVLNADGDPEVVGAEFTLHTLLDFYSGFDKGKLERAEDGWLTYDGSLFTETDVIRALATEVKRLRNG